MGRTQRAGCLPATAPIDPDLRDHLAGRNACRARLLEQPPRTRKVSQAQAQKLKAIAQQYQGSSNKSDIVTLGAQIASEIAKDSGDAPDPSAPLLAIPFTAPAGPGAAGKFAVSTFAPVYGRLAISRHGHVTLAQQPLASVEDHSIMWSRSYSVTGSDPAAIAADVDSKVPSLEE